MPELQIPTPTACVAPAALPDPQTNFITGEDAWKMFSNVRFQLMEADRKLTGNELLNEFSFQAKENQHFKKIEALNTAAKNLAIGNFEAFEEFTAYEDSDYDSSDYEEEPPSDGPPIATDRPPVAPAVKPPPKSDKNHEVKPKERFLS